MEDSAIFLKTTIPETTDHFLPKNNFIVNANNDTLVKIKSVDFHFDIWFLDENRYKSREIIDKPTKEHILYRYQLSSTARDRQIIASFGGKEVVAISLSDIFSLLKKQKDGESGALVNNGSLNIFYVWDKQGVFRVVSVHWGKTGWAIDAFSFGWLARWRKGRTAFVFSPRQVCRA